jgi:hypothetical protein
MVYESKKFFTNIILTVVALSILNNELKNIKIGQVKEKIKEKKIYFYYII